MLNCGVDANRVNRALEKEYPDAVVAFSDGDDRFLDTVEPVMERASTVSCPVLLTGVSEEQKRRLEEKRHDGLRVLTDRAPPERLWEELAQVGVERDPAN